MARPNRKGQELSFKRFAKGKPRGRWFKIVRGDARYFGSGTVGDRDSYEQALRRYRRWLAGYEEQLLEQARGPVPSSHAGKTWTEIDAGYRAWGQAVGAEHDRFSASAAGQARATADRLAAEYIKGGAARDPVVAPSAAAGPKTVGALVDLFLADQKQRNDRRHYLERQREQGVRVHEPKGSNLSDYRHVSVQTNAAALKAALGHEPFDGSEQAAARLLKAWRETSEALLLAGTHKPNTFNERMKLGRQFVGWCDENYHLERMPRGVKKLCGKYAYQASAKAIPLDVIRKLWGAADDLEKVFIALGLNLGYYAKDISDMSADMVQGDYVAHRRGKSGVRVRYKLWGVTKTLLARTRMDGDGGGGRLFKGKFGRPLVYHPEGKASRVDVPRTRFYRLCEELGVKGYSFSNLRDRSSTHVENIDRSLTDLFDAHSDGRMARFYVDGEMVDTSALDAVIDRLEAVYALVLPPEPPPA